MTSPPARHTRRSFLAGVGAAGLGLGLAACGESDEPTSSRKSPASGSFPARVPHKYGMTTIERAPKRVATYGGGDVDTLLALGITPVLVPDIDPRWKETGGIGPWSRSRVRGEAPVVANLEEIEFEKVAATRPDLFTAVEYDLKRPDYDKLSELTPTVPPPRGYEPYTVPWDVMAKQVGAGLGRTADAEKLVKATRDRIAAAAEANPKFATSKAVLIDPDDDGGVYVFSENDVRTRFLRDLGLKMPAEIQKLFGKQFYAQISAERLDLLDAADVLVLVASRKPQTRQLTGSRSYKGLRAVREERLVTIDDPDLAIAMSYSSVLSTPYQLREVVPRLRAALA
ncbi:MAG TPA: ABC transporter substrate-binding protein [Solirubrobacteraceae bacterium]|nr:ABC transporter substrate-binding protein [Solirubrobacteraceae bacterium]